MSKAGGNGTGRGPRRVPVTTVTQTRASPGCFFAPRAPKGSPFLWGGRVATWRLGQFDPRTLNVPSQQAACAAVGVLPRHAPEAAACQQGQSSSSCRHLTRWFGVKHVTNPDCVRQGTKAGGLGGGGWRKEKVLFFLLQLGVRRFPRPGCICLALPSPSPSPTNTDLSQGLEPLAGFKGPGQHPHDCHPRAPPRQDPSDPPSSLFCPAPPTPGLDAPPNHVPRQQQTRTTGLALPLPSPSPWYRPAPSQAPGPLAPLTRHSRTRSWNSCSRSPSTSSSAGSIPRPAWLGGASRLSPRRPVRLWRPL